MKIGENTFVSLSYALNVNGEVVDSTTAENPLQFVYGAGYLLPKFEENITGLSVGDSFEFTLTAADGYGEVMAEALVELPKSVFMIDGAVEDGLLELGNQIPMSTQDGQRLLGVVKILTDEMVTMDFNHPMAGQTLNFSGTIVGVREATDEDMMHGQVAGEGCGCGCSCEDGGCEDGDCGDKDCGCK